MLKQILAAIAAFAAATAFAAVDVNKATQAELEAIKGIGPVGSRLIMNERKKGEFKNWDDFKARVKGVGDTSAKRYSEGGLVVNGTSYASPRAGKSTASNAANAVKESAKGAASAVKTAGSKTAEAARRVTDKASAATSR